MDDASLSKHFNIREFDNDELDFEYEDNHSHAVPTNFRGSVSTETDDSFETASTNVKDIQQTFIKLEQFDDEYNRNFMHNFEDETNADARMIDSDSESDSSQNDELSSREEDALLNTDSSQYEEDTVESIKSGDTKETATNFTITFNNFTNQRFLQKRQIRRKPWAVKPYTNSQYLSSSDSIIKYIPESKFSIPDNKTIESPPTNLIISLNDDTRTVNSTNSNPFKMPLRRPPTRQHFPKIQPSSDNEKRISNDSVTTLDSSDDAISIIGSESITGFDRERSPSSESRPSTFSVATDIKEEVSSVSSHDDDRSNDAAPEPLDRVKQWVATNTKYACDYKSVPFLYRGLCFRHFLTQNCRKINCGLSHVIVAPRMSVKFEKALNADLISCYEYSVKYPLLHAGVYKLFASEFNKRNMRKEVINIIENLFKFYEGTELIGGIDYILREFENHFTFSDAVDYIVIQIGLSKLPTLDKVLINVVLARTNLPEHWPIIRKLLIGTTSLDVEIASTIISKLIMVFPIDKKLWCEIHNTLIVKGLVDREKISKDLLDPLEMVVLKNINPNSPIRQPFLPNLVTFPSMSNPQFVAELQKFRDTDDRILPIQPPGSRCGSFSSLSSEGGESTASYVTSDTNNPDRCQSNVTYAEVRPPILELPQDVPETDFDRLLRTVDRWEMQYIPEVKKRRTQGKKPPENPVFGNLVLKQTYILDGSLHNFYTMDITKVDKVVIDEMDVVELDRIIKSADGRAFLQMLKKYEGPATVQNFISMSLAHLRGLQRQMCAVFSDLLMSIENEESNYWNLKIVRVILEVIAMNLILYLTRRNSWQDASMLLQRFTDWDSLVTSMVLTKSRISLMGRYIFFAKVFAYSKMYSMVYEILQNPRLNLLKSFDHWPYFYNKKHDIEQRNEVLKEFFNQGYKYSITCVSQMYKQVFQHENIFSYDCTSHFNPMITNIVNSNLNIPLKGLSLDLDIFYKFMSRSNLRAFIICLFHFQEEDSLLHKYYEMGVEREIFPKITGHEKTIVVRTDMLDEEFEMILKYYFDKLKQVRPPDELKIEIGLPHPNSSNDIEMLNVYRSLVEINKVVVRILETRFDIYEIETPWPMVIKVKLPSTRLCN